MSAPPARESLPLFPLNTVLFPGGLLSLQIFEVRYLDMIGKCHKNGTPFGVVSLVKGREVRALDPRRPTGDAFPQEQFANVGTLAKTGGTGTSTMNMALTNSGTVRAASGIRSSRSAS